MKAYQALDKTFIIHSDTMTSHSRQIKYRRIKMCSPYKYTRFSKVIVYGLNGCTARKSRHEKFITNAFFSPHG